MLSKILSFITNPFADVVGGWQARKTIAAETAATVAKLDGELKAAKIQAKIDRTKSHDSADISYDLQVLKNRALSIMDEILIVFWLVVFSLHFIPAYAATMDKGWQAIAKAPWWFQFGMLGILVSTLGLMRLFRMWTENKFRFGGAT
jgi:hypothetical protein